MSSCDDEAAAERRSRPEPSRSRSEDGPELAERHRSRRRVEETQGGGDRPARRSTGVRHPGAQSGEAQCGRSADRPWHRRQRALEPPRRDGGHGGGGDDAGSGHRGRDAQCGRAAEDSPTLGTVAAGKSADFIVLDANPLDDITNTRRIAAVYLRGAAVDRAAVKARWNGRKS